MTVMGVGERKGMSKGADKAGNNENSIHMGMHYITQVDSTITRTWAVNRKGIRVWGTTSMEELKAMSRRESQPLHANHVSLFWNSRKTTLVVTRGGMRRKLTNMLTLMSYR